MMETKQYICTTILLFIVWISYAQIPKAEKGVYALTNATIETVTKGRLTGTTLIIKNRKILDLGTNISIPNDAKIIDCSGLTIYPGMIDGITRLGLLEVKSDPRTRDYNEIGNIIPQVQALTAVNPNSVLIPVTRVSGVTTVLTMPSGGLFSGTAALINLHGYTPEQMYAGFKGVVLNFPSSARKGRWDKRSDEDIKKDAEKKAKELDDVWKKVVQYHKIDSATNGQPQQEYYPEMESLLPVLRKERKLLINVNASDDIKEAIKWVKEKKIDAIFCGVAEGWRVADEIAKANIPVIVGPVLSTPTRAYDRYDKPYANPSIMKKAGVKVAISTVDAENVRNLPYHAGFAATYGLGKEEALKAVTIVPAEIFGVDDKYGSIEVGKIANLFVTDGDPFETKTQVKHLFIEGWKISLESRHTQLYDEFLNRSPGLKK